MTHRRFLSLITMIAVVLAIPLSQHPGVSAAPSGPKALPGHVPPIVAQGHAQLVGHHRGNDVITLAVGLPLRNTSTLRRFLRAVKNPSNERYHTYLRQSVANQDFNPTPDQEQRVVAWLQSNGLTVTQTYPNHLLVDAQGTFAQVERLLHITINDYKATIHGKDQTFYAPANDPTVDASVSDVVQTIVGLDNVPRFHTLTNGNPDSKPPYYPQDFADAYDVNPLWNAGYNGSSQHIGITLWTVPPSDSTLQSFASATGANVAKTTNGRLKVIPVDGGTTSAVSPDGGEAGMDIEYSGGMAPGATIDYYEAPTDSSGNPTDQGLLDALNKAGTDSNDNLQISSSWGGCEASSATDPWTVSAENIFASNSATGHTYFFSSGDNGSWCSQDPYPDYPASSPNVVAVGGTTFSANVNGTYPGESAWVYCSSCDSGSPEGSGGGYSNIFSRPSWQPGSGMRGYPDISADADPSTGAYVCYGSSSQCGQFGGTSLSSPLWAGMLAVLNQYLKAQGKPTTGFLDPTLYLLASASQAYAPFHDITSGTNGAYNAGTGWDPVTGWGSPDLYNLARDMASPGAPTTRPGANRLTPTVKPVSPATPTPTPIRARGSRLTPVPTVRAAATPTPTPVPGRGGRTR